MVSRSCGHNRNMLGIEFGLLWASLRLVARVHAIPIAGCVRFPGSGAMPFFATLAKLVSNVANRLKIIVDVRGQRRYGLL